METLRIKSTHPESQGEFVEINAEDFDPGKGHVLYTESVSQEVVLTPKVSKRKGTEQ